MTVLCSHYNNPFDNARTLLSHHEKAGRISKQDVQPKKKATKWYLEKVKSKDAETHIYTEHYVRTLKNLIPLRAHLQDLDLSNLTL